MKPIDTSNYEPDPTRLSRQAYLASGDTEFPVSILAERDAAGDWVISASRRTGTDEVDVPLSWDEQVRIAADYWGIPESEVAFDWDTPAERAWDRGEI